jgi:hypothetical protein
VVGRDLAAGAGVGVGAEVLLGMRLLADHELRIAVKPGGAVEITALP